jgi:hypothetical protein
MRASKLLLPLFLFCAACKSEVPANSAAVAASTEYKNLMRQNDSLRSAIGALKGEMSAGNSLQADAEANRTLLRYELPVHPVELGDYLEKKEPALLPGDAALGGTMHIETALPLAGNHVFVTGSDGHNYRYWLLQYEARVGKGVQWQRVWTSKAI